MECALEEQWTLFKGLENVPSRQDGLSIWSMDGLVRQETKRLKTRGYTSAAMTRSEARENPSKGVFLTQDQKNHKSPV